MTVVSLYYTGRHGEIALPLRLDAFQRVKDTVLSQCQNISEAKKALLACDEALTNIVCYSGASSLDFSCSTNGDMLSVSFSDNGIPFDPTAAIPVEKDFERLDGGMGLNLIRQCTSSMHYERRENRNILTLNFSLSLS
jgi:anti-sigma regulatory factor (Ser/Thr protein kinase)